MISTDRNVEMFRFRKCCAHTHMNTHGEMRNRPTYTILVGKSERKTPLGGYRHRLEDNIKLDLNKIGCRLDSSGSRSCPTAVFSLCYANKLLTILRLQLLLLLIQFNSIPLRKYCICQQRRAYDRQTLIKYRPTH